MRSVFGVHRVQTFEDMCDRNILSFLNDSELSRLYTLKQISAGVAPCNMVGFVKLFRTSVARQVSRNVEPLSTSATARNGRSGEKQEFHRVTPLRESCFAAPLHISIG